MNINIDEFLWTEKYRPKTIDDVILPDRLLNIFKGFREKKDFPHLILSGPPGVGKTTVAKALLDDLEYEYMIINGSLNGDIETLRNDILNYVSTMSFTGKRKCVIIDEIEGITKKVALSLRNFTEEFSNTSFIFTCNYKNAIIDALHSRSSNIEFNILNNEKSNLAKQIYNRVINILDNENIKYDKKAVSSLIIKYFFDIRRILNELQKASISGTVESNVFTNLEINELIKLLKEKNFYNVRKWISENSYLNTIDVLRLIYNHCYQYYKPNCIPKIILILAKYQYQDSFVIDKEINLAAALIEIMAEADYVN